MRGFPWILAGYFNVIRSANEEFGDLTIGCYENEFSSCLDKLGVWDHVVVGCFYLWSNRQSEEEFVAKKLDRVLINKEWGSYFGHSVTKFLLQAFQIIQLFWFPLVAVILWS